MSYPNPRESAAPRGGNRYEFHAPRTIAEAEDEILALRRAVRDMNAQLQDHNRMDLSGNRYSPREYNSWRAAALRARSCAIQALDAYVLWKQRQRGRCSQADSCSLVSRLRHAVDLAEQLLSGLLADVEDVTPEEQRLAARFRSAVAACSAYALDAPKPPAN